MVSDPFQAALRSLRLRSFVKAARLIRKADPDNFTAEPLRSQRSS